MERYRTIKRYGSDKKYVVLFELSDNSKYYISNGYKFVLITKETTIDDLKANAKQYSLHGAKVVGTKLWKKFDILNEMRTGYRIIQSAYIITDKLYNAEKSFALNHYLHI